MPSSIMFEYISTLFASSQTFMLRIILCFAFQVKKYIFLLQAKMAYSSNSKTEIILTIYNKNYYVEMQGLHFYKYFEVNSILWKNKKSINELIKCFINRSHPVHSNIYIIDDHCQIKMLNQFWSVYKHLALIRLLASCEWMKMRFMNKSLVLKP